MANNKQLYKFTQLPTSVRAIEKQTGRTLSIRTTSPLARLRIRINKQSKSTFFTVLPPEVRIKVYEYVFAEFRDGQAYPQNAKYKRPGYEGPNKTDYALLLTCRKIWLEAHHFPISQVTPTFWFWNGPRDLKRIEQTYAAMGDGQLDGTTIASSETEHFQHFFKRLTPLNRTDLNRVQIFASEAWLRSLNPEHYFNKLWFAARVLQITVRKFDWTAASSTGTIDTSWMEMLLACPLLAATQELKLSLEMDATDDHKLATIASVFANLASENFTCNNKVEVTSRDDVASATVTWKRARLIPAVRKHPKGYTINDGQVETFVGVALRGKPQKRGGRRSQSVWYRNHWEPDWSAPEGKKALRDGKAAALTEEWVAGGSLLCLV